MNQRVRGCKQDERPPRGWWAPGNYVRKCVQCGELFQGDKRAGNCADCAYSDSQDVGKGDSDD